MKLLWCLGCVVCLRSGESPKSRNTKGVSARFHHTQMCVIPLAAVVMSSAIYYCSVV